VFDRPCLTARRVGSLLTQRGWPGRPIRCRPDCLAVRPQAGVHAGSRPR
jgi:hypothetical protein